MVRKIIIIKIKQKLTKVNPSEDLVFKSEFLTKILVKMV
jgi:hypothetical protein